MKATITLETFWVVLILGFCFAGLSAAQDKAHPVAPVKPAVSGGGAAPTAGTGSATAAQKEAAKTRGVPDDYQIGPGDVLKISVWKEPEASVPNAVVRPDGKISMPLIKEIQVVGLTPAQAEKAITDQLASFITSADVTVVVSEINSKKIYAMGGVKKEGPIPYSYQMTVLQALNEAGGLSDFARRSKIYVLRTENGKSTMIPFNYNDVLKGKHMELNIVLLPGDTVVVPQ